MTITSVSYGKTFNLGNYENEKLHATVALDAGMTPEQALAEARAFVEGQHADADHLRALQERVDEAHHALRQLTTRLRAAHAVHTQIVAHDLAQREILLALGVSDATLPLPQSSTFGPQRDEDLERTIDRLLAPISAARDAGAEAHDDADDAH
ncbi:hypothetical protein F8S13_22280 [Chloroflexia bacterium SDU3-3]|nr:hypothetical protein F8S13_22280 [Chloroflexia bacterium SDU3-3]